MRRQLQIIVLLSIVTLSVSFNARCQTAESHHALPGLPLGGEHLAMDYLNLQGAAMSMPPFSDSAISADSPFRRDLAGRGIALRFNTTNSYFQNMLDALVPKEQQAYVGERPTWKAQINGTLTSNLHIVHLHGAQFYGSAVINRTNWNPNGPNALSMTSLYLFKSFAEGRIETKSGYLINDWEFMGMFVGGSLSSGPQGVYAVLPFEVGLSRFPLPAPSFNLKIQGNKGRAAAFARTGWRTRKYRAQCLGIPLRPQRR